MKLLPLLGLPFLFSSPVYAQLPLPAEMQDRAAYLLRTGNFRQGYLYGNMVGAVGTLCGLAQEGLIKENDIRESIQGLVYHARKKWNDPLILEYQVLGLHVDNFLF